MLFLRQYGNQKTCDLSGRRGLRLVLANSPASNQHFPINTRATEAQRMSLSLARIRLLNALKTPPRVQETALTIASYFEGRDGGKLGLEMLAGLMGHPDQWKFGQRAVKELDQWQRQANIQILKRTPGERNVQGKVTEFHEINVNNAALWISQQLPRNELPTLAKIDAVVDEAITKFLRRPLVGAVRQPEQIIKPKRRRPLRPLVADGPPSQFELNATPLINRFRVFPVNPEKKKPHTSAWIQNATQNANLIKIWGQKFPNAAVGILTGTPLSDGGFLSVLDKDRHGDKFGDGFKTVQGRSNDLGPLLPTLTGKTPHDGEHSYFRTTKPLKTRRNVLGPNSGLDCKSRYGFVIGPGSHGYSISADLPIAWLPEAWENALTVDYVPAKKRSEGERHDYLRGVAYAMACQHKGHEEIMRTLRIRLRDNCEPGGRLITDQELEQIAMSAVAKINRADRMLDQIVA